MHNMAFISKQLQETISITPQKIENCMYNPISFKLNRLEILYTPKSIYQIRMPLEFLILWLAMGIE